MILSLLTFLLLAHSRGYPFVSSGSLDYDTLRLHVVNVHRQKAAASTGASRSVLADKLQRMTGVTNHMVKPNRVHANRQEEETKIRAPDKEEDEHDTEKLVANGRELIRGGETAQPGRYPYLTVLYKLEKTLYKCAATLIAPDLLLASATCATTRIATDFVYPLVRVGVLNGPFDDFGVSQDQLLGINQIAVHPEFRLEPKQSKEQVPNSKDIALISLFGKSTIAPVKLNIRKRSAASSIRSNFTMLGWGQQFQSTGPSRNLQQVNVQLLPTDLCVEDVPAFQGLLTSDMICGAAASGGVCNLDLGNPLMEISSDKARDDIQIAVVSFYTPFSATCSKLGAPVAFANVFGNSDWIRDQVCNLSLDPPRYFRCDETPLVPGDGKAFITIVITMDCCPKETGWLLQTFAGKGEVLASVRPGTYTSLRAGDVITETFELNVDMVYRFVLLDDFGDGLDFLSGDYRVYRGNNAQTGTLLFSYGGTDFEFTHVLEKRFILGSFDTAAPTIGPTEAPTIEATTPPTPALSAVPSFVVDDSLPYMRLTIYMDSFPEETGWTVRDVDTNRVVARRDIGSYATTPGGERVVERINLAGPEGGWKSYQLEMLDSAQDGLCCLWGEGSYQLEFVSNGQVTFDYKGSGEFSNLETVVFAVVWSATSCLEDDQAEFVFAKSLRTCLWLGKKKRRRIEKICNRRRRFTAHEVCPKTCGTCHAP